MSEPARRIHVFLTGPAVAVTIAMRNQFYKCNSQSPLHRLDEVLKGGLPQ
jgi:hypothetical protein